MKVFEMWKEGSWLSFEQKAVASVKYPRYKFKKIIFNYNVTDASPTPFDTHHGVVINRAKFDACTSSSFRGVKTNTQTDKIALYTSV